MRRASLASPEGRGRLRRRVGYRADALDSSASADEAEVLDEAEQAQIVRELFAQSRTLDHAWRIFCLVAIVSCGLLCVSTLRNDADARSFSFWPPVLLPSAVSTGFPARLSTFLGLVFASLSTLVSLLLAVQDKPASASPEASPRINRPPLSPILALPEHHRLHAPDLHLAPLLPVGVAATAPVALMALYDLHRDVIDVQHATQWLLPFGCALMAFVTRRMIEGSQSEVRSRRVVSNADGLQLQSLERLKCATAVLRAR